MKSRLAKTILLAQLHLLSGCGFSTNFLAAVTSPSTSEPAKFQAQTSEIPHVIYQIDAAAPATDALPVPGEASIQIDSQSNVLALNESVSFTPLVHGYGQVSFVPKGESNPFAYFHGDSSSLNNGYDGLVLPNAGSLPFVSGVSAGWSVIFVMKQLSGSATELFVAKGTAYTHISGGNGSDGALSIGQDTAASTTEPSTSATALRQWQVVSVICDGSRISVYRNGVRTVQTSAAAFGEIGGVYKFELLNNPQADVAFIEMASGAPSIAQHDAEVRRLASLYSISVSTVTQGSATQIAPATPDLYADFMGSAIFPITNTPLVDSTSTGPGDGIVMAGGTTPLMNMYFPGAPQTANVASETVLRNYVYMNYFSGNQNTVFGYPIDNGQSSNSVFAAVARHYPLGSSHSTTPVLSDGLHFKAFCAQNSTDCRFGHVYGGFVRFTPAIRPGMTIKVRYRAPSGTHSWAPIWLFSGEQRTPGPGGNAYGTALIDYASSNKVFEVDINDNYPRFNSGAPSVGNQLDFGTPDIYGNSWPSGKSPTLNYLADNGSDYVKFPSEAPPYLALPNLSWSSSFHNLVMNWRGDGSNLIDILIDGKVVQQNYIDYSDVANNNAAGLPLGLHLMLGNQAIPSFSISPGTAVDNDGIHTSGAEGWTMVVQEVSIWNGNISSPDSLRATP